MTEDDLNPIESILLEEGEKESKLIENRKLLDPTYIVDEDRIVGRDEQLNKVARALRVILEGDRAANLFLYGPSGTGKSLITKAVCRNLKNLSEDNGIRLGTVEMNCRNLKTLDTAVHEMGEETAKEAGTDYDVPRRGYSTEYKYDKLFELVEENFDSLIYIFNELDMLSGRSDKDEPAFSRLLYTLSRLEETRSLSTNVTTIAISNDTRLMDQIDSRAESTFSPEEIHFDDYDANQLRSILDRRRDAFREGVLSESTLPLAAALAAQDHGDARKAIDLLRISGDMAELDNEQEVTEEHVKRAQKKIEESRVLEVIRGLSPQKKYSLYSTAKVASMAENRTARSVEGYRVYQHMMDEIDADKRIKETYTNKLKELSTYSLLNWERNSEGPSSGAFLEFKFETDLDAIVETLEQEEWYNRLDESRLRQTIRESFTR
ncbi:AAA family ATPase [Haladaptatus sp. F3-133]|uniref:ORC1-type DNA replication protein n=1 Tax=Halorutilus salinus TaxID=2487751 RepID=A0A9Q4C7P6_9EURY|nr:AAA family ATPase [Halorutilus salinus]MCX2819796.1 AAA family ATPase [Halorutilus salinus]